MKPWVRGTPVLGHFRPDTQIASVLAEVVEIWSQIVSLDLFLIKFGVLTSPFLNVYIAVLIGIILKSFFFFKLSSIV